MGATMDGIECFWSRFLMCENIIPILNGLWGANSKTLLNLVFT